MCQVVFSLQFLCPLVANIMINAALKNNTLKDTDIKHWHYSSLFGTIAFIGQLAV